MADGNDAVSSLRFAFDTFFAILDDVTAPCDEGQRIVGIDGAVMLSDANQRLLLVAESLIRALGESHGTRSPPDSVCTALPTHLRFRPLLAAIMQAFGVLAIPSHLKDRKNRWHAGDILSHAEIADLESAKRCMDRYLRTSAATPLPPKATKRRKKRPDSAPRPLTPKQTEAVQIVGECNGNIADAARKLGVDRKTVSQHYAAAMAKLGQSAVRQKRSKPQRLPSDRRGQEVVIGPDGRDEQSEVLERLSGGRNPSP